MADSGSSDTPRKMTAPEQLVINALAVVACELAGSTRTADAIDMLAAALPLCRDHSTPHARDVIAAADAVLDAWPACRKRGGATAWTKAMLEAEAVLSVFFFWRAAQLHMLIWPHPVDAPIDPEPVIEGPAP
jgi:hypothetical protein